VFFGEPVLFIFLSLKSDGRCVGVVGRAAVSGTGVVVIDTRGALYVRDREERANNDDARIQ
jgi:hypothetical protein